MSTYVKGDIIYPDGHPELSEEVIYCDGVRVTTHPLNGNEYEYYTREVRDIERYWCVTE